jgi:hypothetical protein
MSSTTTVLPNIRSEIQPPVDPAGEGAGRRFRRDPAEGCSRRSHGKQVLDVEVQFHASISAVG